jgi:uncharacterized membrane protein YfhO
MRGGVNPSAEEKSAPLHCAAAWEEEWMAVEGSTNEPRLLTARMLAREWGTLLLLQLLLSALVFWKFLDGSHYFAYLDIAGDTYEIFAGNAMHAARLLQREGWTGWSFGIGLGAPVATMFNDTPRLLTMLAGPDHVLALRIWVHLFKVLAGGGFFYLLVRPFVVRREAALVAALLYSFCGFMLTNGIWDPEANPFVFFPLILWSLLRLLRRGDVLSFPLSVAAALYTGYFFLTLAVSIAVAFVACVLLSGRPAVMLRQVGLRAVPLAALGYLLAAPYELPLALQLLDSPRVSGSDALISSGISTALEFADSGTLLIQLSAFFHKDILGSANYYFGYMNYLEGPDFWVGMLPLLVLPQLLKGDPRDRHALLVGIACILAYMVLPAFRLAAFGFASPYFRSTTLWVTLPLLLLGARGLDQVLHRGVDLRLLAAGAASLVGLLALVTILLKGAVVPEHVWKVAAFILVYAGILLLASVGRLRATRLTSAILLVGMIEIVVVAWPSINAARPVASPTTQPFKDVTVAALEAIRRSDPGAFRVEKTFASMSESDPPAQDYWGVRSYYYHGSAVVDFHRNMDMMRKFTIAPPGNQTNWLEAPGDRYVVSSALGVRYVISKEPLDWPGFELSSSGPGWFVYRNELALPLGVVHSRQVTRADMAALEKLSADRRRWFRDLALVNAVVLDDPMPQWGQRWDVASLAARGVIDLLSLYVQPVQELQRSGLKLTSFRNDHLQGRIEPASPGILVFSIPAYKGWSLRIDGEPVPLMRADFGFIAAPVSAGAHQVDLRYQLPGLRTGFALGLFGLAILAWVVRRSRATDAQPR